MKNVCCLLRQCILASSLVSAGASMARENNPVASSDAVVTVDKARFTVLTPEMVRIEYSDK